MEKSFFVGWHALIFGASVVYSDFCIWGRKDSENAIVNGQYIENEASLNGKPSFNKSNNDPCSLMMTYLYWNPSFGDWSISTELGGNSAYAFCQEADLSDCTAGKWTMTANGAWFIEPNLYAQSGTCPQWHCASITSDVDHDNCKSFNTKIGTNAWQNPDGYVWSFNPLYFRWSCINGNLYDYQCASAVTEAETEPGWIDRSGDPSTKTFDFGHPYDAASVTCTGVDTTSSTSSPISPMELFYGTKWILILHQDTSTNSYFQKNIKTNGRQNEDDASSDVFTIIGSLNKNDFIDDDGSYQFRLVYGDGNVLSDSKTVFDEIWSQKSWLTESNIVGSSLGDWTQCGIFIGLSLSSSTKVFLDGGNGNGGCIIQTVGLKNVPVKFNGGLMKAYEDLFSETVKLYICTTNSCNSGTETLECSIDSFNDFNCSNPTISPTESPTANPTIPPTTNPTQVPSFSPTHVPSYLPSAAPSFVPTISPSRPPSETPTSNPPYDPTPAPSIYPTINPSEMPSMLPTNEPTVNPSMHPTYFPSANPTKTPTKNPSGNPTDNPTTDPSVNPTQDPSSNPTENPTTDPTSDPSMNPSSEPSHSPSFSPTNSPSMSPTNSPTLAPTIHCPMLMIRVDVGDHGMSMFSWRFDGLYAYNGLLNDKSSWNDPQHRINGKNIQYVGTNQWRINGEGINYFMDRKDDEFLQHFNTPLEWIYGANSRAYNITIKCITTVSPTSAPTNSPTFNPSHFPTNSPTKIPTNDPSLQPTDYPTNNPSLLPSEDPSTIPSQHPTNFSSIYPTLLPSYFTPVHAQPTSIPTIIQPSEIVKTTDTQPSSGFAGQNNGIQAAEITLVSIFVFSISIMCFGAISFWYYKRVMKRADGLPNMIHIREMSQTLSPQPSVL